MAAGGAVTLAGLLSFISAIALDIDSGSRRGALEAHQRAGVALTSVNVAPTEDGVALQLGGRF